VNAFAYDPARIPYVTDSNLGTGGIIKSEPRHFSVEEIPLYEASGEGEHVYFRLRREGRTTMEVIDALARLFGLRARDVGCAGQKDKRAIATQTLSLAISRVDPDEAARRVSDALGIEVLWARRHSNKLRRGHLLGNRFDVLIEDVRADALACAREIAGEIALRGLPNFYGPQRFGADGRNAERGREILAAPRRDARSRFMLSALQSMLFNEWLAERMRLGRFDQLWRGDVGKRRDNGALFEIEDVDAEQARMSKHEITYTGPMFGAHMRWATDSAGDLERAVLDRSGIGAEDLALARLDGSRRAARLFVDDLAIDAEEESLRLRFSLPKGAYATVLLRELMKTEGIRDGIDEET
jgi:tRNA pseudouridine13 synthase